MASDALRVRTLFRIAHFNEFRGKAAKAVKYYSLVRVWQGEGVVSPSGGRSG